MASTSYRLDDELKTRLAERAASEGCSETSLVTRLLSQGLAGIAYPGIVFRPGPSGWRAAVAGGPDVAEVIESVREAGGDSDTAISAAADALEISPRLIRVAVAYAAAHPEEIDERIRHNAEAAERVRRSSDTRSKILTT